MTAMLVTGATGFLGRALTGALTERYQDKVLAISRRGGVIGETAVEAVDLGAKRDVDRWLAKAPSIAEVFHLAARIPSAEDPDSERLLDANVMMSEGVLAIATTMKAHIVYASSAYVYRIPSQAKALDESCEIAPSSQYHLSKSRSEYVLLSGHGVKTAVLRIASPYGAPQARPNVLQIFLERARRSEDLLVYGTGGRTQDFVHVDDVVAAMLLAHESRAHGVFNIASGRSVDMWTLAETIRRAVPGCRSQVRLSGTRDPQEHARWVFDITRARSTLGYAPSVTLADGIRRLVQDA